MTPADVLNQIASRAARPCPAAPPDTVNIHAQLVDSGGQAITGFRDYVVRFFDAESGGAQLGPDITGTANLSVDGLFNLSVTLPPQVLDSAAAWYEVAVDSDTLPNGVDANDLFPQRVRVQSVPFALQAAEALSAPTESFSAYDDLTAEAKLDNDADDDLLTRQQADGRYAPAGFSAYGNLIDEGALDNDADGDLLTRQQADARYGSGGDGVPSTAIVLSETNPNANLTGYTYLAETVLEVRDASMTPSVWTATTTTGAPAARQVHTAVWTGTEMIVWGGNGVSIVGGRYDAAADTWTPVTTAGAPTHRAYHTAVWTGAEMIVWGGHDSTYTDTGGRYDPVTDSWEGTATAGAPTPRQLHTAVWTGDEMVIWGGSDSNTLNTGGHYHPAQDHWVSVTTADAPTPRNYHRAVWTGDEMVIWGGFASGVGHLNTGGRISADWSVPTTLYLFRKD